MTAKFTIKNTISKLAFVGLAVTLAYTAIDQHQGTAPSTSEVTIISSTASELETAYKNRTSDVQVHGQGTVVRVLPDDTEGSRHQKFIIKTANSLTVLISHNIDLAPRLKSLQKGDNIGFFGEYEWNSKGGVIHWTHHDPNGRHVDGWLKYKGRTYQ